jgi:hypothetical protein
MKRDYWRASSKAIRYDGVMVRRGWAAMGFALLLAFALAFFVSVSHAQVQLNNSYRVWQFKGSTVGEKTVKAQEACSPDTDIPCLIVFDPVLAIFPAGTMPAKCAQCFWLDYRNPSALFGSGAGGVGTSSNTQVLFNDGGALGGDAGITYNKDTNTLSVGAVETTGTGYNNLPSQADSTTLGDYWRNGDAIKYRASTGTKQLATTDQIGGASSYEILSSPRSCTAMPGSTSNWQTTCLWTTEISGTPAIVAADGNRGVSLRYQTGATINTTKGVTGGNASALLRFGDQLRAQTQITFGAGSGEQRFWFGFTDQTGATLIASDNPAGNLAGLWYCNDSAAGCDADSTTFQCVVKDGTTRNRVDSGVTVSASARYGFEVRESPVGTWHFYIKSGAGALTEVCGSGITTNAPTTGANSRWAIALQNLAAVSREVYIEAVQYWSDR